MCFVWTSLCFSAQFIYLGENYPLRFLTAALSPLGIGIGRGRGRLSARQTAARSLALSSLSLNEQVHRELRRVEAAATTDNEPGSERRTSRARTGDGATCHGSDTRSVHPCVRAACVTLLVGQREREI